MITTAGGLALDGSRWITIDENHFAMQTDYLAAQFKRKFLRRLKWMVRRNRLVWPTADHLPANFEALVYPVHFQPLRLRSFWLELRFRIQ